MVKEQQGGQYFHDEGKQWKFSAHRNEARGLRVFIERLLNNDKQLNNTKLHSTEFLRIKVTSDISY